MAPDAQPTAPATPDVRADFALDLEMQRGGGMNSSRPVISYNDLQEYRLAQRVTQVAVAMHPPTQQGHVNMDSPLVALPAEKYHKWFGKNWRPDGYVTPTPPPPTRWLQSMIEEAMNKGEPIPEEMRPPGYMGPTFQIQREVQQLEQDPLLAPALNATADGPDLFHCSDDDCKRFFDSATGRDAHARSHK